MPTKRTTVADRSSPRASRLFLAVYTRSQCSLPGSGAPPKSSSRTFKPTPLRPAPSNLHPHTAAYPPLTLRHSADSLSLAIYPCGGERLVMNGTLTDVLGIEVGHYTDAAHHTGCTVVLTRAGAIGGVDVRGGAPGTRETDLLKPGTSAELTHAIALSGGSAYGLATAAGVMRYLEEQGIGPPRRQLHRPHCPRRHPVRSRRQRRRTPGRGRGLPRRCSRLRGHRRSGQRGRRHGRDGRQGARQGARDEGRHRLGEHRSGRRRSHRRARRSQQPSVASSTPQQARSSPGRAVRTDARATPCRYTPQPATGVPHSGPRSSRSATLRSALSLRPYGWTARRQTA